MLAVNLIIQMDICMTATLVRPISFMTYNINYSRRAKDEFAEYSWDNRKDAAYDVVRKSRAGIVFLQEVLCINRGQVSTTLTDYSWHFEPINSRNGVCCNAIGIHSSFMPKVAQLKFSFNFNQIEKTAEKVMGLLIGDLCLVNCHFPMAEAGRMAMADGIGGVITRLPWKRLIVAGDLNAFPDARGKEQLELIRKGTGTERVSDLARSQLTRQVAVRSFVPYPYDKVPKKALAMPGKLDHVFVKGLQLLAGTCPTVGDARKVPGKSFAPSDHFDISLQLVNSDQPFSSQNESKMSNSTTCKSP